VKNSGPRLGMIMAYRPKSPIFRAELRNGGYHRRHLAVASKTGYRSKPTRIWIPNPSSLGFVSRGRIEGISTDIGITPDSRDAAMQKVPRRKV
jgi:hypothetical protein